MKKYFFILLLLFFSLLIPRPNVYAQTPQTKTKTETLEGTVLQVNNSNDTQDKTKQVHQVVTIQITKGSLVGQSIIVDNGDLPVATAQNYHTNDRVLVAYSKDQQGNPNYYIIDYIRWDALLKLFLVFLVVALVIGKFQGFTSILSMAISFLIIFAFILPKILAGEDPVFTTIVGSFLIIPITFAFAHGINKKTFVAIIGTAVTLIFTGLLSTYFVNLSKLTGFGSDEASYLQSIHPGGINMKGLLLAGIIISVLGILNDITVSQSAIVFQLKETATKLSFRELYSKAMHIGHDHIASTINTLILVYAGASLPLLLLLIINPNPISEVINYEIIASEVVKTLVGSIGLILAVPITTIIACLFT